VTRENLGDFGVLRHFGFFFWTQFHIFDRLRAQTTFPQFSSHSSPSRKVQLCCPIGHIGINYVRLALRRVYPAINGARLLSVISRHIDPRPPILINTPYSIERLSGSGSATQQARRLSSSSQTLEKDRMSSQPEHPALLIPGPIEFDDAVLQSMSHFR